MYELLIEHGIEAVSTIIIALVGIWVSGMRKEFKGFSTKLTSMDEHLESINGDLVQMKIEKAECQGDVEVELTKRPDFVQAREIVKEHVEVCPARNKSPA